MAGNWDIHLCLSLRLLSRRAKVARFASPQTSLQSTCPYLLSQLFSIDNHRSPASVSQFAFDFRLFKMMASLTDHNSPYTQPVCQNCQTSTTPLWRRDESGSVLCNACGLFLKLHGRPRPISLKTDVIKSRNRVKSSTQGLKKKVRHKAEH